MKRTFSIITALCFIMVMGLTTSSFAQAPVMHKDMDLEFKIVQPKGNMPNITQIGDTVRFGFMIINHGPDTYRQTDSDKLYTFLSFEFLGQEVYNVQHAVRIGTSMPFGSQNWPNGFFLDPGDTLTLGLDLIEGTSFFNNDPAEIDFPDSSKVCYKLGGFCWQEPGNDSIYGYNDPGFDFNAYIDAIQNSNDPLAAFSAFTGNNFDEATVIFGDGHIDICANGYPDDGGGGDGPNGINDVNTYGLGIEVAPNPVRNQLTLSYAANFNSQVDVRVVDLAGRTVLQKDLGNVDAGEQYFHINTSSLQPGMYMIEVRAANGKRQVTKFVKK